MVQPLVEQLAFTRAEFVRAFAGVSEREGVERRPPMNCLSWIVGHLADQEQRYWLGLRGADLIVPELNDLVGFGKPASTPPLAEMWAAWRAVNAAVGPFLDSLTGEDLLAPLAGGSLGVDDSAGTLMTRVLYHYWYHIGESQAIRQMQGAANLEDFVGDIGGKAPYRRDS